MGDRFLAISAKMKDVFLDVIPEGKITLSYDGIDPSMYNIISTHSEKKTQFVMVGGVSAAKGQLEAVRSMAILKERGFDACLTILGSAE